MQLAKAGKYNGYLREGMACPGGCVAGAGTMQAIKKSPVSYTHLMAHGTGKKSKLKIFL